MLSTRSLQIVLLSLAVSHVSTSLLPEAVCTAVELGFQLLGCAGGTSTATQCELLALLLQLGTPNAQLCDQEPCAGYGNSNRFCTSLFPRACNSADRIDNGICPFAKECCSVESFGGSLRGKMPPFLQ